MVQSSCFSSLLQSVLGTRGSLSWLSTGFAMAATNTPAWSSNVNHSLPKRRVSERSCRSCAFFQVQEGRFVGKVPRASSKLLSQQFAFTRVPRQQETASRSAFPRGRRSHGSRLGVPSCSASANEAPAQVFQGVYGPWSIDEADKREVYLYRAGIVSCTASLIAASIPAFLPLDSPISQALLPELDLLFGLGAASLGSSLFLIHIYVNPIKVFMQLLWGAGCLGSVAVAATAAWPAGSTLVDYALSNPVALLLIGPSFAALTGLVFKEGLCYGKLEAALLVFIIPTTILGHMSGLLGEGAQVALLGTWVLLQSVFASRKFSQAIKDDIGDKSVFMFNALPPQEQSKVLDRIRAAQGFAPEEDSQ